ncbi:MAG: glycosyltransferase [Chloroflexota bacterium]
MDFFFAFSSSFNISFLLLYQIPGDFLAASKLNEHHETSQVNLPHNILAWGIWHATKVNTVSPKYAEEIQSPELGEGLDGLLRQRRADLAGIVNGIDYSEFDPSHDSLLPANYDASALEGKAACKAELQKRMGLPQTADTPIIGMVTRMDEQKGFDLLPQAIEQILAQTPAQLVILGRGRPHYEVAMKELAARYADRLAVTVAFDNPLAHLIYAGADFFLMPSRFEPCGLGQLVAMHYGTVPVVRHTGGLADTVHTLSPNLKEGSGFVFQEYTSQALIGAVQQATEAFGRRRGWAELQSRLMRLDFSWTASAQRYEEVYRQALRARPSLHP